MGKPLGICLPGRKISLLHINRRLIRHTHICNKRRTTTRATSIRRSIRLLPQLLTARHAALIAVVTSKRRCDAICLKSGIVNLIVSIHRQNKIVFVFYQLCQLLICFLANIRLLFSPFFSNSDQNNPRFLHFLPHCLQYGISLLFF